MKKLLAIIALTATTLTVGRASATIVFDNFNTDAGHFGYTPSFSTTGNVAATSTATRITTDGIEGGASMQLNLVLGATNPARVRWVSGGPPYTSAQSGNPAFNNTFTLTAGTDGFIGYYYKTNMTNAKLSISLDDSTNTGAGDDGGLQKTVIADNQWHLMEWNLDLSTDWAAVAGVGGDGALQNGTRSIDSIFIYNITAGGSMLIDFVALNSSGSVANLLQPVPEASAFLAVGLIGLVYGGARWTRNRRTAA